MVREIPTDVEQDGLLREAAHWCLELSSGEPPPERIAQWRQWLATSDAHREAFDCIQSTCRTIDRCTSGSVPWPTDAEVASDAYDGSVSISAWRARLSQSSARRASHGGNAWVDVLRRHRRWMAVSIAAGIVAVLTASIVPLIRSIEVEPPAVTIVETGSGENREVPLADGSTVNVGARSMLWATLTHDAREVTLERGEAFFHVAKDPARPFTVRIGTTTVAAVGTAFNVRRAGERVVVAVAEGIVKVDVQPAAAQTTAQSHPQRIVIRTTRLSVGQQLSIDATDGIASIQTVDADGIAAWREGLLEYRDEPLQSVVADVIRYSARDIVIANPEVANLRITGTVFANDTESWLQSLEAALPVRVIRARDGAVRLESRPRN